MGPVTRRNRDHECDGRDICELRTMQVREYGRNTSGDGRYRHPETGRADSGIMEPSAGPVEPLLPHPRLPRGSHSQKRGIRATTIRCSPAGDREAVFSNVTRAGSGGGGVWEVGRREAGSGSGTGLGKPLKMGGANPGPLRALISPFFRSGNQVL
jgi:hypothetical protein